MSAAPAISSRDRAGAVDMTAGAALARLGAEAVHLRARLRERRRPSRDPRRRPAVALRRLCAGEFRPLLPGHRDGAPGAAAVAQRAGGRAPRRGRAGALPCPAAAGAEPTIALPKEAPPGLAVGLGGLGITLADLTRLYAGLARGGDAPALVRRLDGAAPVPEPARRRSGRGLVRRRHPARRAAARERARRPHRLQDRHVLRLSATPGRSASTATRRSASGSGGRTAPRCRASSGALVAAPILFDAYRPARPRAGAGADAARMRSSPRPRRCRRRCGTCARTCRRPSPRRRARRSRSPIPLDGSRVELGFARAGEAAPLALKAAGGVPPLTWLVNGAPVTAPMLRRQATWSPDGAGFARVSVMDAEGATDSVVVRIE